MECFSLHGADDGYYRTLASWSVSRGSDELSKQTRYIERWWSWWNSSPAHKGMQHQITPGLCMIFNQSKPKWNAPVQLKTLFQSNNVVPVSLDNSNIFWLFGLAKWKAPYSCISCVSTLNVHVVVTVGRDERGFINYLLVSLDCRWVWSVNATLQSI